MKNGLSLTELAVELERQHASKRDFLADTRDITMTVDNNNVPSLALHGESGLIDEFNIGSTAHDQLSQRLGIPKKYYDRMLNDDPQLLAQNVNNWFEDQPERRMLRTLDGNARAFLSERYRTLDNFDLGECVLPIILGEEGAHIESCQITERRLYIKALFPRINGEVFGRDPKVGDAVQSGIVISNSEIGHGSLRVEPLLFTLWCTNGCISNTSTKKYHVGRAADDAEGAIEIFRSETLEQDDKAFWMKIADTVHASLDDSAFKRALEHAQRAQGLVIDADPVKVVEITAERYNMTEGERSGVLSALIRNGNLTAWGLSSAVTEACQKVESYERSTELERVGGHIIELEQKDWSELLEKAA